MILSRVPVLLEPDPDNVVIHVLVSEVILVECNDLVSRIHLVDREFQWLHSCAIIFKSDLVSPIYRLEPARRYNSAYENLQAQIEQYELGDNGAASTNRRLKFLLFVV